MEDTLTLDIFKTFIANIPKEFDKYNFEIWHDGVNVAQKMFNEGRYMVTKDKIIFDL